MQTRMGYKSIFAKIVCLTHLKKEFSWMLLISCRDHRFRLGVWTMSKTVVVSDLHVDRWDEMKLRKFLDFLYYVRFNASCLVINGDLMDFPPFEGKEISETCRRVLYELAQLPMAGVRIVYLPGNHDIALRGFPISLPRVQIVYPSTVLQFNRVKVYIEHGHYYDPLFNGGYEILDGLRKFTGYDIGKIAVDTWKAATRFLQRAREDQSGNEVGPSDHSAVFLERWRHKASEIHRENGYDFVVFGHTHSPKGPAEEPTHYLNTGDWVTHMTVTEFSEDGVPQQYDWNDQPRVAIAAA